MAKAEPDVLVDEIEEIRERLAGTVDALIDRTNPKNILRRGLASLKGRFVDETGSPRMGTIVPVVGGTAAVVAGIIVIRRLVR
ncbi:DUF3618 domain-containing protein [Aeromicrobium sp.]|uniref:DUF3618 domain-containing protein n=1 Tax=Aeromicrobium sp. TaxID=1871063 RepID=UPI00199BC138|nr:DUF3618 domain-containing protein [Aeromicrobium sp.]MBC7633155.1 DUF3618 domain-containing protein [Aeromicrobium sp.]